LFTDAESSNEQILTVHPSLRDKLAEIQKQKFEIGPLLQEALISGYKIQVKYRATKQSKKNGPAKKANTIQVYCSNDVCRCTWGQHTNCSVSERAIVKLEPGIITLRSYCENSKKMAYDYLYDENGAHVLNAKVSLT
jgi:hypothetical protein